MKRSESVVAQSRDNFGLKTLISLTVLHNVVHAKKAATGIDSSAILSIDKASATKFGVPHIFQLLHNTFKTAIDNIEPNRTAPPTLATIKTGVFMYMPQE